MRWGGEVGERRLRREGTHEYLWWIHAVVWKKPTQYCKAIIIQLKKKKRKIQVPEKKCTLIVRLDGRSAFCQHESTEGKI